MFKRTITLLMVTFALTVSLHAEDYKKTVLEVTANVEKMEVSKTTTLVDGEPCGTTCLFFCIPVGSVVLPCTYTYCEGGTYLCLGAPIPPEPKQ